MINYILQVVLFQALFLAVYDLFLQKETFFKWNRGYLLVTPLLSFMVPLLKFESLQKAVSQEYIVKLSTVFLNPQTFIEQSSQSGSALNVISIVFYIGLIFFSLLFLIRLAKIFQLIASNKVIKKQYYSLVLLEKKQSAFSFFNYIFINEHLLEREDLQIIKHELVHCKQRHTVDLVLFEVLKIVLWFNPMVYVYQKRITLLHEYISDAEVVKETDKKTYFNKILSETFNIENSSFINQFFKHSFIKKRIVMITKEKSKKMKQLKYLLVVPLLAGMLGFSSFESKSNETVNPLSIDGIFKKEFSTPKTKSTIVPNTQPEVVVTTEFRIEPKADIQKKVLKITDTINPVVDVPFAIIENVPVFPGCEGTQEELRLCIQDNITKHVNRNFNISLAKNLGLKPGLKRIFVKFKIDEEGNITDVESRAPHIKLQEEAIRVVRSLPKMLPGKQKGKPVAVKYSLPIAFIVGESDQKQEETNLKSINAENQPLYILEGEEISLEEMKELKVESIKSMNVLKGESAVKKYGDKGKNGVVIITKKQ